MYDDINVAAKAMQEDKRIDLMRRFVDLTQSFDNERESAREREEKIRALGKEREAIRSQLLDILSPSEAPAEPMRGDY